MRCHCLAFLTQPSIIYVASLKFFHGTSQCTEWLAPFLCFSCSPGGTLLFQVKHRSSDVFSHFLVRKTKFCLLKSSCLIASRIQKKCQIVFVHQSSTPNRIIFCNRIFVYCVYCTPITCLITTHSAAVPIPYPRIVLERSPLQQAPE